MLEVKLGLVSGNILGPSWPRSGVEVVEVLCVLTVLRSRRKDCPDRVVFRVGFRPQSASRSRNRLVFGRDVDLLIGGVVRELSPVRLPPRLPYPGVPREESALERLPVWIIAAAEPIELGIIETLTGKLSERTEDFALGPPEIEVPPPPHTAFQVVFLHELRQLCVLNDQSVIATGG